MATETPFLLVDSSALDFRRFQGGSTAVSCRYREYAVDFPSIRLEVFRSQLVIALLLRVVAVLLQGVSWQAWISYSAAFWCFRIYSGWLDDYTSTYWVERISWQVLKSWFSRAILFCEVGGSKANFCNFGVE